MVLGADCIDDCDVLRRAAPVALGRLGARRPRRWDVLARVHVRACASARPGARRVARRAGRPARPGRGRLVIDVDVRRRGPRHQKQGAAFGYTQQAGYHPLLATRADTGEVLHMRLREGLGEHARGMRALHRRADRPRRACRRDRLEAAARRLRLLEQQADRATEQADWQYSIGVRMIQDRRGRIGRSPRTPGRRSTTTPKTGKRRSPRRPR